MTERERVLYKWKTLEVGRKIVKSSWKVRIWQERWAKWWKDTEDSLLFRVGPRPGGTWHQGYLSSCVYPYPHFEFDMSRGTNIRFLFPVLLLELHPACFRFPGKSLPWGKATDCCPTWRLAPSFGGWHCQSGPRHGTHLEKEATCCVAQMGCHWAGTLL